MLRTNSKVSNGKVPPDVPPRALAVRKPAAAKTSVSPVKPRQKGGYGGILLEMAMCVAGIYTCFGLWSIKQERIITKPYSAVVTVGVNTTVVSTKLSTVFVLGLAQVLMAVIVSCVLLLVEQLCTRTGFQAKEEKIRVKADNEKAEEGRPGSAEAGDDKVARKKGTVGDVKRLIPSSKMKKKDDTLGTQEVLKADTNKAALNAVLIGFTNGFASMLGFAAMRRLPYPVVLATKMSKMVPVILVGFFWHGTRYSLSKCLACALITGGSFCFYMLGETDENQSLKGKSQKGSDLVSWFGFFLLFLNLLADGFTNSTQDKLVQVHGWTGNKLMLVTNLSTAVWLGAVLLLMECVPLFASVYLGADGPPTLPTSLAGFNPLMHQLHTSLTWFLRDVAPLQDFSRTMNFFNRHPEALRDVIVMSVLNAAGQLFIFRTISLFGSLTVTALTLLRKSASVVLSIIVHDHSVTAEQWFSLLVVFAGAVWEGLIHARK